MQLQIILLLVVGKKVLPYHTADGLVMCAAYTQGHLNPPESALPIID